MPPKKDLLQAQALGPAHPESVVSARSIDHDEGVDPYEAAMLELLVTARVGPGVTDEVIITEARRAVRDEQAALMRRMEEYLVAVGRRAQMRRIG